MNTADSFVRKIADTPPKPLVVGLTCFIVVFVGCKQETPSPPEPKKEPVVVVSASDSAKAAVPLPENNAPKEIPTLTAEYVNIGGAEIEGVHLLEDGTIAVHDKLRVGRIVDDKVEWLEKEVPDTNKQFGWSRLFWVGGRWPDALDVMYQAMGRAPQPTYAAFTGKGNTIMYGASGARADLVGVARLGESTLVAGVEESGAKFGTIRGPTVMRTRKSFAAAGCKEEEQPYRIETNEYPALVPRAFGATGAGTVISMGLLCGKRNATLEVWPKDTTTSKLMDLGDKYKQVELYDARVLPGAGDEAWIRLTDSTVLHYVDGRIDTLPEIPDGAKYIFISPNQKLYGANSWGIHRWDRDHWTQVARFGWEESYSGLFADGKEQFWRGGREASIMRPGKSTVITEDCPTPFVFLYDVSYDNKPDFTFPSTRKALSSFPEVDELTLVEFKQSFRRLGIIVKRKAQGEAVIEHIKKTMPKEKPRLMCYAPEKPRIIEIKGK